jgi:hypothetical protein
MPSKRGEGGGELLSELSIGIFFNEGLQPQMLTNSL